MQLNSEIAYFLGPLRDGYIDKKQYLISIAQKDITWLKYLQEIIAKNFQCKSRIRKFRGKYFELRIFSKYLFELVQTELTDIHTVPLVIKTNKKLWKPYIEGFFDAEGYCTSVETYTKTGKKKISFHQNDLKSLQFIASVMNEKGIKNSIYLQRGRKCYALYIQSSEGIRKFADEFQPFLKNKRINDLVSVLPLQRDQSWFLPKCIGVQPCL